MLELIILEFFMAKKAWLCMSLPCLVIKPFLSDKLFLKKLSKSCLKIHRCQKVPDRYMM